MADIFRLHGSSHDKIRAILPWYVNGTLKADEADMVDAHLAECADCRAELDHERALASGIANLPLDVEQGWSDMKRRMARGAAIPAEDRSAFFQRKVSLGWALAGPIAAAAAIVLMVGSDTLLSPSDSTFHALGSQVPQTSGNLVVLFRPDTTVQQIQVMLTANEARVVDGPTAAGAYVLHVDQKARDQVLVRLRQSSRIVLAEPVGLTTSE